MMKKLLVLLLFGITIFSCKKDECYRPENISSIGKGCGSFFLYDTIFNDSTFLWVKGVEHLLNITGTPTEFIFSEEDHLTAGITKYNMDYCPFCKDVLTQEPEIINEWTIVDGAAFIYISYEKNKCDSSYYICLELKNSLFNDSNSNNVFIENRVFENVMLNSPID